MPEWIRDKAKLVVAAFAVLFALFALTFPLWGGFLISEKTAISALEKAGFSDVKVVDDDMYFLTFRGCDVLDWRKFDVEATNPVGKKVDGVSVCVGLLKNSSIMFE